MTRDYKNRRAAAGRPGPPCWLWGLAGLLVGLFAAFLVYLGGERTPGGPLVSIAPPPERPREAAPPPPPEPPPVPAEKPPPKPRFEFYSILPEMEVPVEEPALPARPRKDEEPAPETEGETTTAYLLQVGSFRSLDEADRLKAGLTLLGLEPRIQTVTVDGERTWHRVRVGPYPNLRAAYRTRDRLRAEEVEAIVLKVAGQ